MDYYATLATEALNRAGHAVTPADRVPGLFNVEGVARDVTVGQLWQLAQSHGSWNRTELAENAFARNTFGITQDESPTLRRNHDRIRHQQIQIPSSW